MRLCHVVLCFLPMYITVVLPLGPTKLVCLNDLFLSDSMLMFWKKKKTWWGVECTARGVFLGLVVL